MGAERLGSVGTNGGPEGARNREPRRIVFHHDSFGFGGMELYMFSLIAHLDRERYTPALLVPGFTDEHRSSDQKVLDEADRRGITVLRPPDPGRRRVVSAVNELASTVKVLRRFRPAVVHIHTCRPLGARKVTLATRLAGVAGLVRTEHFPPSVTARPPDRHRVRLFDLLTDVIVTGSEGDRAEQIELLRRSPTKVVRCYNSVDLAELDPVADVRAAKRRIGLDPDVPVITNIGRLVDQKGQRYLIEAFAQVLRRVRPVNLVIVGDGPLRPDLDALCERLAVTESVHFVGFRDDVRPYLAATDVAAMPSQFEVFSLAMLEFMAMGKPVVASDHSSFAEAISDGRTGIIVPRADAEGLADGLVRLLEDESLRSAIGGAACEHVRRNFGFERLAAEMMDVYDRAALHGRN
jgi:glycosyltransferase involved in cell wall biosynthesis